MASLNRLLGWTEEEVQGSLARGDSSFSQANIVLLYFLLLYFCNGPAERSGVVCSLKDSLPALTNMQIPKEEKNPTGLYCSSMF